MFCNATAFQISWHKVSYKEPRRYETNKTAWTDCTCILTVSVLNRPYCLHNLTSWEEKRIISVTPIRHVYLTSIFYQAKIHFKTYKNCGLNSLKSRIWFSVYILRFRNCFWASEAAYKSGEYSRTEMSYQYLIKISMSSPHRSQNWKKGFFFVLVGRTSRPSMEK